MREKEAREIVECEILFRPSIFEANVINHSFAKGYLSSIEKANGLEEAIANAVGYVERHPENALLPFGDLKAALAKWKKEK